MWVEKSKDWVSIPAVFIVKDNPITVGAYSVIFQNKTDPGKRLVVWIHKVRYTAKLVKKGEKATLNIVDDYPLLYFCGHVSGREYDKVRFIDTKKEEGYTYIPNSEIVLFGVIEEVKSIADHKLVVMKVEKVESKNKVLRWGDRWKRI